MSHLILSGTLKRFRNLKIIVLHYGGALPLVASRVGSMSQLIPQSAGKGIDPPAQLAELYYDSLPPRGPSAW